MFQAKPAAHWRISIAVLIACWTTPSVADLVEFDIPLDCPKLESLQAMVPASGGSVAVSLQFAYDSAGKLYCSPGSTVDGSPVYGKGSQKGTADYFTFAISVKGSGSPSTSLSISGISVGGVETAKCSYKGPKGKASLRSLSVNVGSSAPTAHVIIEAQADTKGRMTGTGTITSGFENDFGQGILKGQVGKGRVKWGLKQGRESLSFSGFEGSSSWVGTMKVALPPAKETSSNFSMPILAEAEPILPGAPTGLQTFVVSDSRIDLSWSASAKPGGVAGYYVYRDGVQVGSATGTTWSDTSLEEEKQYCYSIASYDFEDNLSAQCSPKCATTPKAPTQFPGFDITLSPGAFWAFAWDYKESTGSQGSSGHTTNLGSIFYVYLGAPVTIAGKQAYAVELYGPTSIKDGPKTLEPRWRYLATSGGKMLGSTDGTSLVTVYDMRTGGWPGGGFFTSFPTNSLIQGKAGTIANNYLNMSAVVAERSSSQSQCEYFPGYGNICGDSSYNYKEKEYFAPGIGPIGYYYENSYSDCGGGFCSWGSWVQNIGLIASSFSGESFSPCVEVEPNNSRSASQLSTSPVVVGTVNVADPGLTTTLNVPNAVSVKIHDFYAFDHPGGAMLITLNFEAATGADLDLFMFDTRGSLIGYAISDNVQTGDLHEALSGTLAAGRYYFGISGFVTPSQVIYNVLIE